MTHTHNLGSLIRLPLLVLALCALISTLGANPFLSSENTIPAPPALRTPTSQGPLVDTQRDLREHIAKTISAIARDPTGIALFTLLGAAMLYGALHAAGPGHRKTVVFSLFIGRKASLWEPLAAGFLAAGVHAGSGMALVGALSLVYGAIAGLGDTEFSAGYIDAATFGLLILLSLVLVIVKIREMIRGTSHAQPGGKGRNLYRIVLISSLVPCPGATMILLFALYAGIPWLGVIAVISMSVGMGVVISAVAYLAYAGRQRVFEYFKTKEQSIGWISDAFELASYMILLGFSFYMAWPMIESVIS